ncbi:hypothetical protein KEM48_014114 [Puccinia striiformis f. sp. tritici PST-130]|nr:hypothetical protein KEM48_014114 [Puccinia striiformis f. sp. tritici PST-130]
MLQSAQLELHRVTTVNRGGNQRRQCLQSFRLHSTLVPPNRPAGKVFALNAFPQGFENLQELIPSTPEYPPGTLSSPSKSQRRKGMVFSP